MRKSTAEMTTKLVFDYVISKLKSGELKPVICAKNVCVDAHIVTPDDVGKKQTVCNYRWRYGKAERTITLTEGMVLLTTLDENGKPIIDERGQKNVYDMKLAQFQMSYPTQVNGHYVNDPYTEGAVKLTVKLPDDIVKDGLTILPPNWHGYEGTLLKGGILIFPFDPKKGLEGQILAYEQEGYDKLDWYPNNNAQTYSACDKNGTFENESLRKTFNQTKQYEGKVYSKELEK